MSNTNQFINPRAANGYQGRSCAITGVGSYVPERILTNADLEKMVETNNEWILERTGIAERHIAPPEMATALISAGTSTAAQLLSI